MSLRGCSSRHLRRTAFVAVQVSNLLNVLGDCFGYAPPRNDIFLLIGESHG